MAVRPTVWLYGCRPADFAVSSRGGGVSMQLAIRLCGGGDRSAELQLLFTTPRYSLQMFRPEDIFNLVVFMVVAFITSSFADLYRRQQGELKQTKLQNSILLSVSHDLRTPLATIIGTLTTLNEYMPKLNDLERKELLDSATSESHRLHQYIENLLQATKLQHGTLKLPKAEPIANIVRDAVSRLPNYTEKVSMNMDDSVGYLSVSRSLIEQAILMCWIMPCDFRQRMNLLRFHFLSRVRRA